MALKMFTGTGGVRRRAAIYLGASYFVGYVIFSAVAFSTVLITMAAVQKHHIWFPVRPSTIDALSFKEPLLGGILPAEVVIMTGGDKRPGNSGFRATSWMQFEALPGEQPLLAPWPSSHDLVTMETTLNGASNLFCLFSKHQE